MLYLMLHCGLSVEFKMPSLEKILFGATLKNHLRRFFAVFLAVSLSVLEWGLALKISLSSFHLELYLELFLLSLSSFLSFSGTKSLEVLRFFLSLCLSDYTVTWFSMVAELMRSLFPKLKEAKRSQRQMECWSSTEENCLLLLQNLSSLITTDQMCCLHSITFGLCNKTIAVTDSFPIVINTNVFYFNTALFCAVKIIKLAH